MPTTEAKPMLKAIIDGVERFVDKADYKQLLAYFKALVADNANLRRRLTDADSEITRLHQECENLRHANHRLNDDLAEARLPRGLALYDYLGDNHFDDDQGRGVLAPIAHDEGEEPWPLAKLEKKFEGRITRERIRQLMKDHTIPGELHDGVWFGYPDDVERYLQKRLAG